MNGWRTTQYLRGLLHELRALPRETEWVEFKKERSGASSTRCRSKTVLPHNA